MKKFIFPKRLKRIALILAVVLVLTSVVGFLNSIGYNLVAYLEYGLFAGYVNFEKYEGDFEIFAEQLYLFVDSHPDFFEEFN